MLLRKQAVKWYFICPPQLTCNSALPGEEESRKLPFHLNAECCFANRHTKHIHIIITWSQLNRPLFPLESTICTKQNLGRQYSMLPSVTTHSSFSKSVMMSVAVSKVVLCRTWSEKSKDSIGGISYYLNKHIVDDNIICLSATRYCMY